MKRIILGTAGHIDHGKTALIRAITGIDTDRLKEEKKRGITIELGFAHMELPSGEHLGIVDVPGHERFIDHMVAGATGIDMVLLVIAADEGVMPQTREHLDICRLLGIEAGLIALTKVDLVDEELMELVLEDVTDFVEGSFLEGCPIIPTSVQTREGLDELVDTLSETAGQVTERSDSGLPRMPIDRVFTMHGFGTVVTGTLASGAFKVGDAVQILPGGHKSKVRGIQIHNEASDTAMAGVRTAINLQGLEKEMINRGEVLVQPDTFKPSFLVDVHLSYLPEMKKALRHRTRVMFHTGTTKVFARVVLHGMDELASGKSAFSQLRLEEPVITAFRDRFIIRDFSTNRTIGGGRVVNAASYRHKRSDPRVAEDFETLLSGNEEAIIRLLIRKTRVQGIRERDIVVLTGFAQKSIRQALDRLVSRKEVISLKQDEVLYIDEEYYGKIKKGLVDRITAFHRQEPLKEGITKEELKAEMPRKATTKLFNRVLGDLDKEGAVVRDHEIVRLASHKVTLGEQDRDLKGSLLGMLSRGALQPPTVKDLAGRLEVKSLQVRNLLNILIKEGRAIKVTDDLYFSSESVCRLRDSLVRLLKANGEITTQQFKELAGVTRKFAIPLAEYFDSTRLTIRVGDKRLPRDGALD